MSTTPQARQSAVEKSLSKGPTRPETPKLSPISTADSPVCGRCTEGRRAFRRGLCRGCYAAQRGVETLPLPPCRECGQELKLYRHVRGLCWTCHQRQLPVGQCLACRIDLPLWPSGLCRACYQRQQRADPNVRTRELLALYLHRTEKRLIRKAAETLATKRERRNATEALARWNRRFLEVA